LKVIYESVAVARYESHLRAKHASFPKKWSLFFARYRLLTEFAGVEFHSLKGNTAKGYEIALKLGLAHTALEALQNARPGHPIVIKDKQAARIVRSLRGSQFEDFLVNSSKASGLRNSIRQMFASQNIMDLSPMVEAIRNSAFHGSFTPYSAGFTKNADVRLIMNLSFHLILDAIDVEIRRLDLTMFDV
jgi:hypothetical protein